MECDRIEGRETPIFSPLAQLHRDNVVARLTILLAAALVCAILALQPSAQTSWAEGAPELWAKLDLPALQDAPDGFMCPMDRDVISKAPGYCPRCRMKLKRIESGQPADAFEYPVEVGTEPAVLRPGASAQISFFVKDPRSLRAVNDFEVVHEKLYHVFLVSQDLGFFLHTHPVLQPNAHLLLDVNLPKAGMYRVLSDFYPKGGTPQLVASTLLVPGAGFSLRPANVSRDLAPKRAANLQVELVTDPPVPLAHAKTQLLFRLTPNDGIEPYLGAMAHMLAASSDLIDMTHSHPIQVEDRGGIFQKSSKQLQFQMIFPRVGVYRVWVQTQRRGTVNTVAFNIPVGKN